MESIKDSDEAIVIRILNGEHEEFSELLQRYQSKVAGLIFSITNSSEDVEDLAQEVFISVYQNLSYFQNRSRLGTWIYRITVNKCYDWLRRKKVKRNRDLWNSEIERPNMMARHLEYEEVRTAINTLDEKYRIVIILYYFHDLKCRETAEVLQLPQKTIETRLLRGREMLSKILTEV